MAGGDEEGLSLEWLLLIDATIILCLFVFSKCTHHLKRLRDKIDVAVDVAVAGTAGVVNVAQGAVAVVGDAAMTVAETTKTAQHTLKRAVTGSKRSNGKNGSATVARAGVEVTAGGKTDNRWTCAVCKKMNCENATACTICGKARPLLDTKHNAEIEDSIL